MNCLPPNPLWHAITTQDMARAQRTLNVDAYNADIKWFGIFPLFHGQVVNTSTNTIKTDIIQQIRANLFVSLIWDLVWSKYPVNIPIIYGAAWG